MRLWKLDSIHINNIRNILSMIAIMTFLTGCGLTRFDASDFRLSKKSPVETAPDNPFAPSPKISAETKTDPSADKKVLATDDGNGSQSEKKNQATDAIKMVNTTKTPSNEQGTTDSTTASTDLQSSQTKTGSNSKEEVPAEEQLVAHRTPLRELEKDSVAEAMPIQKAEESTQTTQSKSTILQTAYQAPQSAPQDLSPQKKIALIQHWKRVGPPIKDRLWELYEKNNTPIPEYVYRDVLPAIFAEFELLNQLDMRIQSSLQLRRKRTIELITSGKLHTWHPLAQHRLTSLLVKEQDVAIWQTMLNYGSDNPSAFFEEFALAGTRHPNDKVREMSCLNLGQYPRPGNQKALMVTLQDSHTNVAQAAAHALGSYQNREVIQTLKKRQSTANTSLQLAIASSLSKLGDAEGIAALERMTFHNDSHWRSRAASSMAAVSLPEFLPSLIRMLDDPREDVQRSALDGLYSITKQPHGREDFRPTPSTKERIFYWKQWWSNQAGQSISAPKPNLLSGSNPSSSTPSRQSEFVLKGTQNKIPANRNMVRLPPVSETVPRDRVLKLPPTEGLLATPRATPTLPNSPTQPPLPAREKAGVATLSSSSGASKPVTVTPTSPPVERPPVRTAGKTDMKIIIK